MGGPPAFAGWWLRLAGAPETSPALVWCSVVREPLSGDHSPYFTGRRGLHVDGGPASRWGP